MENQLSGDDSNRSMSPAVDFIVQTLEQRIRAGHYNIGQRLPAERALAEEFDVSRTTVRLGLEALAQRGLLERANACRPVVRAPEPGRRISSPVARRNVAIWIFGEPNDYGCYSALQGVQQTLDPDLFRLVIASPRWGNLPDIIQSEAEFLTRIGEDREIAGLILWYLGGETNRPQLARLHASGLPLVFMDRRPPGDALGDYVGVDNRRAARDTVRHFLARGHRRVAHVTYDEPSSTVIERMEGYREALREAGVDYDPALVFNATYSEPLETRYRTVVEGLCALQEPPNAIFTVNDYAAWFLIAAMRQAGTCRPEDFEIAGFDDLERWLPGPATLTSVRQPFEQIGTEAARLLQKRLGNPHSGQYATVFLDAPLIVRDSTRSARSVRVDRISSLVPVPDSLAQVNNLAEIGFEGMGRGETLRSRGDQS
jgi:DNA-binding LacI/PurR family transcriptional regulator/DNA-binding transcriptional regulator YhcF (GntR family)